MQMIDECKRNRPPPATVIQAVSSIAMADPIIISRSLGIPPPLPPMGVPTEGAAQQTGQGRNRDTRPTAGSSTSKISEPCHISKKLELHSHEARISFADGFLELIIHRTSRIIMESLLSTAESKRLNYHFSPFYPGQ